ncbi:MAG: hypothetical protein KBC00_00730 [Candidatus Levybacteria bacterium]|nr:hypothetical protein [Candidatus Levybacteria bacterium]MBP9814719.1 hypothetical protein [Candidatus Levybacteria bacterium]
MKYLSLTLPGYGEVQTPENIPSGASAPSDIISFGLGMIVVIGIIASLIFMLYAGVLWITSQGDKTKIDRARRTITYSIVGLIIILLSFTIVRIIGFILGAQVLQELGK